MADPRRPRSVRKGSLPTSGGGIVLLGSAGSLVLQMLSLVVLSRLLTPEDFGLVAMVSVFVILANLLRDFGLPLAGLQVRDLSNQQASNLFWMNAAVAGIAAAALVAATPLLIALFDEPRLATVVPFFSIVVLLGGIGSQLQVLLARRSRFRAIVGSDLAGQAAGFGAAVALALSNQGVWALVSQALVAALVTLAARWISCGWMPARYRRGHGSLQLLQNGAEFGVAHLLTFMQNNAATLIIGARLGATQLGYYNRAYQLLVVPTGRVLDPMTQVVVTALNKSGGESREGSKLLLQIQLGVGLIAVWGFTLLAALAQTIIPIVLGPSWSSVIPIFQILAIGLCFAVLDNVTYWAFIALGEGRRLLRSTLVTKPVAVVLLLIGVNFGLTGVAYAYVAGVALTWPFDLYMLSRSPSFSGRAHARNGFVILVAGLLSGLVALQADRSLAGPLEWASMPVAAVLSALVALGVVSLHPATRSLLVELLALMRLRARNRSVPAERVDTPQ